MRLHFALLILAVLGSGCRYFRAQDIAPASVSPDSDRRPLTARDSALEQRAARLELKALEQEAQIAELQSRLDDARREVVRAMAKLQSLATRAEAASGMAEAEIALQGLRSANGNNSPSPEYGQASALLQLATTEFDQQNYGGALYLANEAKNVAAAGRGRAAGDDRTAMQKGEVPFALPLKLETTGRANVREGPGASFKVVFTLEASVPIVAYSYVDQWLRIKDDSSRSGWIHQTLIDRRP